MKCKKCGHANKQGAKFCEECGENLFRGVCPDCGHKNRADAQFCEECGANFKGVVKKGELPKEKSVKPGLPLWLKIAFGAIGLIAFVAVALVLLAGDNYLDELSEKAEKCTTAISSMQILLEEGSNDDTIYSDNDWIAENNVALGLVEEYCTTFGWDNGVPAEFETANDLLLQSRSEYSEFIRLYRVGLSEMDEAKRNQAINHALKADGFLGQAAEALQK